MAFVSLPEYQARVDYLAQILIGEWYSGKRYGDTPNGFRCFTPEEIEEMKTEWTRYRDLADFVLTTMGLATRDREIALAERIGNLKGHADGAVSGGIRNG